MKKRARRQTERPVRHVKIDADVVFCRHLYHLATRDDVSMNRSMWRICIRLGYLSD